MLNNSENIMKIKMLNEFESQLKDIFNNYLNNKLSYDASLAKLKRLETSWDSCRIDLKNYGTKNNSINIQDINNNILIEYPKWLLDARGKGYKISSSDNELNFNLECIEKGNLKLYFRGFDYKDTENIRQPVYIKYNQLSVENEIIFNQEKLLWHNEPYIFEKNCEDKEIINCNIKFDTIFNMFPNLKAILKNNTDFENLFENLFNYIKYERILVYEEDNAQNSTDIYTFLKDNKKYNEEESFDDFFNKYVAFNNIYEMDLRLDDLNNKLNSFESKFDQFKKKSMEYHDSENFLFNTLLVDYELKPKRLLNNLQVLCSELLMFINNICKKYDIDWWLDYGNLLGAARHENFIPWDDDVDIGMMRSDYHRFIENMYDEVEKYKLNDCIDIVYRYRKYKNKAVNSFIQFFVKDLPNGNRTIMAGVDIFPYDYIKKYDKATFGSAFNASKRNYYRRLSEGSDNSSVYMGLSYDKVIGKLYSELNLSYEKQEHIIPGVEGSFGYKGTNLYELSIWDTDEIFPLTNLKYGDYVFPAPNNYHSYLEKIYKNHMTIPKSIRTHGRANNFRTVPNINDTFEQYIYKFKKVNLEFKF